MQRQAPAPLRLVESYLNSVDVESGADDLDSVARFQRWLADHGRAVDAVSPDDLHLARELRDAIRATLVDPAEAHRVDRLTAGIALVAAWSPGGVRLRPTGDGVRGVLGEVLAAIVLAVHNGAWHRMKICHAVDCRYVFYDASKNVSRRWCTMAVCGNRQKTRTYRERQRAGHA